MQSLTQEPAECEMSSNVVQIWLRPLGQSCKIRIANLDDASWFRARLSEAGLECSKVTSIAGTGQAMLLVTLNRELNFSTLQALIHEIPEVEIMLDPA